MIGIKPKRTDKTDETNPLLPAGHRWRLPLNMFYNTGIATYIWVLSNRKPKHRRGKVQLIDASQWYKPLRKNLGKKNCELSPEDIQRICDTFLKFEETEQSKIFPNEAFGYRKIVVERPLRLHSQITHHAIDSLRFASGDGDIRSDLYDQFGDELFTGFAKLRPQLETVLSEWGGDDDSDDDDSDDSASKKGLPEKKKKKLLDPKTWERDGRLVSAAELKVFYNAVSWRDETAPQVVAKIHKAGKATVDPLYGFYKGKGGIVEYESDPDLRDTEQVPLQEDVETFMRREVLPYTPDAWIDASATKIGYEISFTRHFYKPQPLRSLEEIRADILALERETEGMLAEIVGGSPRLL